MTKVPRELLGAPSSFTGTPNITYNVDFALSYVLIKIIDLIKIYICKKYIKFI